MAISKRVQTQLSRVVPTGNESQSKSAKAPARGDTYQQPDPAPALAPAPTATPASSTIPEQIIPHNHQNTSSKSTATTTSSKGKVWTVEEHERFVQGLQLFPTGPWKSIAAVVGTKTPRQTMSHAQKCRQKQERWQRGLKIQSRRSAIATQQPNFIVTPAVSSSNINDSQLIQQPPLVEEIRCNATQTSQTVHFSVRPTQINEERTVKSHVTSVSVGDAANLTQYWNDTHEGPQDQPQRQGRQHYHDHHYYHHHHSLASAFETIPVFPVFDAFEATEHPGVSMWLAPIPSSSSVSSMGLPITAVVGVIADDGETRETREDLLRLFQPSAN